MSHTEDRSIILDADYNESAGMYSVNFTPYNHSSNNKNMPTYNQLCATNVSPSQKINQPSPLKSAKSKSEQRKI